MLIASLSSPLSISKIFPNLEELFCASALFLLACFSGVPKLNSILSFKCIFELPRPLKSLFFANSGKHPVLNSSCLFLIKTNDAKKQSFSLEDIKAILLLSTEITVLMPPFLCNVK